jgi:hypothetical protein
VIQVVCFDNCTEVELKVNKKSYDSRTFEFPRTGTTIGWNTYASVKEQTSTTDQHLAWDVVYIHGEIGTVEKTKVGQEVISRIAPAGDPYKISLTVDRDI